MVEDFKLITGSKGIFDVKVNVARDIQANRTASINPLFASAIATNTFSSGQSGNINVIASNIAITNGGVINAVNYGQGDSGNAGNSGNVNIDVSGTIEVRGIQPRTFSPSSIGSTAFREGNSGSLNLNTSRLIVQGGAGISTASLNSGNGGTITINASESIEVGDSSPNGELRSSNFPHSFSSNCWTSRSP